MTSQVGTDNVHGELPIACTLSADEQATWSAGTGGAVLQGYDEVRELPDGYALRFPGDQRWAATLLAFIVHERRCCRFFRFGLTFEPNLGAIWLHLSGSEEIKAFVEVLMRTTRPAPPAR